MKLRLFRKGMRQTGTIKSTGTLKAKKLLKRLDRERGTKEIKSTQENVERDGTGSWDIDRISGEEKEEENI